MAQLWMENTWLNVHSMGPGGMLDPDRNELVHLDLFEPSSIHDLERLVTAILTAHADKPMGVVAGDGAGSEYLFGPGQVGPFRFVQRD